MDDKPYPRSKILQLTEVPPNGWRADPTPKTWQTSPGAADPTAAPRRWIPEAPEAPKWMEAPGGPPPAQPWTPENPNVRRGVLSYEGEQFTRNVKPTLQPAGEVKVGKPVGNPNLGEKTLGTLSKGAPTGAGTQAVGNAAGVVDLHVTGNAGTAAQGSGRAYKAGEWVGKHSRYLGPASKLAGGAGVLANFNDYKINDPDVDSSAPGTLRALGQGDFAGAGRSLSKGMLETGMDLGSNIANTADVLVPGEPFSQGYNRALRNHFGDQLVDRSGNNADPAPSSGAPRTPIAPAATRPINRLGQGFDDPRRLDRDPGRANLGVSRDFSAELGKVPAQLPADLRQGVIHKTVDANGRTVYSGMNVGPDAQMVDGKGQTLRMRGSVQNTPSAMNFTATPDGSGFAISQRPDDASVAKAKAMGGRLDHYGNVITPDVDKALALPGGGRIGPNELAMMRSNVASGVDPMRGVLRDGGNLSPGQAYAQQALGSRKYISPRAEARIMQQAIEIDRNAQLAASAARTDETQRRGQDIDLQSRLMPKQWDLQVAQARRDAMASATKGGNGDTNAAANELAARGWGDEAKIMSELASSDQTRGHNASNNARDAMKIYTPDKDGRMVEDPGLSAKAYDWAIQASGGKFGTMSESERNALITEAKTRFELTASANARRKNTLFQQIGLDNVPAYGDLPDNKRLRGANLGRVGFGTEALASDASVGDYRLRMSDGQTMYFDPEAMTAARVRYLTDHGAVLSK